MKARRTAWRKSFLGLGFGVLGIVGLSACGNEGSGFFPGADDFRFGAIAVRVFDQQGSPVAGATMELKDEGGNLLLDTLNKTGADGRVGFGPLAPGFYTITIKPPAGYAVPASQPNPIRFDLRKAQDITINVSLVRL